MALTDRQIVRMLCRDTASDMFTDDEIDWFISQYSESLEEAAAAALETMAADAAKVAKAKASGTWSVNLSAIPGELREAAAAIRKRLRDTPYSDVVEYPTYPWETFDSTAVSSDT